MSNIFELSKQVDHNSIPIDLTKSIFMVFWTCFMIMVFCEIGDLVTHQFEKFADELHQSCWYLCSIEMQKMLAIFMSNARQPIYVRGYGNILCSRSKVKEVKKFVLFSEIFVCKIASGVVLFFLDCRYELLLFHGNASDRWIKVKNKERQKTSLRFVSTPLNIK